MFVNFIGCVKHFRTVGGFSGDVVNAVDEDDIVVFRVVIVFDDFVVKVLYQFIVCEFAFAQFHEEVLGSSFCFLV